MSFGVSATYAGKETHLFRVDMAVEKQLGCRKLKLKKTERVKENVKFQNESSWRNAVRRLEMGRYRFFSLDIYMLAVVSVLSIYSSLVQKGRLICVAWHSQGQNTKFWNRKWRITLGHIKLQSSQYNLFYLIWIFFPKIIVFWCLP